MKPQELAETRSALGKIVQAFHEAETEQIEKALRTLRADDATAADLFKVARMRIPAGAETQARWDREVAPLLIENLAQLAENLIDERGPCDE